MFRSLFQYLRRFSLIRYLFIENWLRIVLIALIAIAISAGLLPWAVSHRYFHIIFEQKSQLYFAFTCFILFLLAFTSKRIHSYWRRYRRTSALGDIPLLSADAMCLFLVFSALWIAYAAPQHLAHLRSTPEIFRIYLTINTALVITWSIAVYLLACVPPRKAKDVAVVLSPFSDGAITDKSQDLLHRETFVRQLREQIADVECSQESFVFGLQGNWGTGKSSVINLLLQDCEDDERLILVKYDPWVFADAEAMIVSFYQSIEQSISGLFLFSRLKRLFARYQKLISSGLSKITKFDLSLDFISGEGSQDMKLKLEEYVRRTKRRVVIFIDEIDRLQRDEILMLFKLVRANGNFKNTVFVLSYDHDVVEKRLADQHQVVVVVMPPPPNSQGSNPPASSTPPMPKIHPFPSANIDAGLLKKVVQKPINLPGLLPEDIDSFLDKQINSLLDGLHIFSSKEEEKEFGSTFSTFYVRYLKKLFTDFRSVKRYINSLFSSLPPIVREVNVYDFMLLETLKVFFPNVHKDTWENPWYYVSVEWSSDRFYFESPFSFGLDREGSEKNRKISTHINGLISGHDEIKQGIILEILQELFPVVSVAYGHSYSNVTRREARQKRRVAHPDCFRQYYTLIPSASTISNVQFEELMASWLAVSKKRTAKNVVWESLKRLQEQGKLRSFFKLIISTYTSKIPQSVAVILVKVLYEHANDWSHEGTEDFWNSEYDESSMLMLWLINDSIKDAKIRQRLIEEAILKSPNLHFAVATVLHCRRERGGSIYQIYETVDIPKVQKKMAGRLRKEFITGKKDIFAALPEGEWALFLYQWATDWRPDSDVPLDKRPYRKEVSNYILKLLRSNPKNIPMYLSHWRGTGIEMDEEREGKAKQVPIGFRWEEIAQEVDVPALKKLVSKALEEGKYTKEDERVLREFIK